MRSVRKEAGADGGTKVLRVDMTGVSVLIAMPTHRDLPPHTVLSLLDTCRLAFEHGIQVRVLIEPGISVVEVARSVCVHRFLQSGASKLFFIDSDMQWDAGSFMRMLALSMKADVVCGAYAAKEEPLVFHISTRGRVAMNEWGCIPCCGAGMGFVVIDRKVIEALVADAPVIKYPRGDNPENRLISFRHPFRCGERDGEFVTEDIMFYRDIEALGFTIWCDPTIWLGHIGTKSYEGSFYDHMKEKGEGNGIADRGRRAAGQADRNAGEGVAEARNAGLQFRYEP